MEVEGLAGGLHTGDDGANLGETFTEQACV